MNPSSRVPTSSSSTKSPIASKKSGDTHGSGETRKQDERTLRIRRRVELSSATERCIPRRCDGHKHGGTCRYQRGIRRCGSFRIWNWEWRNCERETGCFLKTAAGNLWPSKSASQVSPKAEKTERLRNLQVSPATIHHTEAVFPNVREIYGPEHDDPMNDLDVNMAFWSILLNATLWAAVHLEQDYDVNFGCVKNNLWYSVGQFSAKLEDWSVIISSKMPRGVDKLFVRKSISVHQHQNLRLLRLCPLFVKTGRWSYWILEEENYTVFGKQSLQGCESNRRHADGVRVENIPRNHSVGLPLEDSKITDRSTVWTGALQRQNHLHVDV